MKEKNLCVLLADNNENDRLLFIASAKLLSPHVRCVTAVDGVEAMAQLHDTYIALPDFIFLDLKMPRKTGRQCLAEIRKDPRLRQIPVFIYTRSRDIRDSIACKQKGVAHFISKPDDPDDVYYILAVVLWEKWLAN